MFLFCRSNKKKCVGEDKKYETCTPKQCYKLSRTTVLEFANQICERAKQFDPSITGTGIQRVAENGNFRTLLQYHVES